VRKRENADPSHDDDRDPGTASVEGGWRAQSPWLKVMLFVSLALVVIGVYRCSSELVPLEGPRIIRVERATVAVPDSLLAVPADSLAVLATRLFARGLREASTADVTIGGETPAWAAVRLHVRAMPEGQIELLGTASSVLGGRRLAAVAVTDSPDRLREVALAAARDMVRELDLAGDGDSRVEEQ
jgi:hypothetical protein